MFLKKLSLLCSVLFITLFLSALPLRAEDSNTSGITVSPTPVSRQTELQATIQQKRTEILEKRQDLKATITEKRADTKDKMQELEDKKQQMIDERCKLVNTNIDTKTERFDNNKNRHQAEYAHMQERITRIITQLKVKGLNTAKLEADLTTLNTKIDKFATDYAAYIAKLKDTKNYVCGHSDGEFRSALQGARTSILPVRQDVADIRNFYQTVIRPDIQALRQQFKAIAVTSGAEEASPTVTTVP